jgi:hypothetical protein
VFFEGIHVRALTAEEGQPHAAAAKKRRSVPLIATDVTPATLIRLSGNACRGNRTPGAMMDGTLVEVNRPWDGLLQRAISTNRGL